MFSHAASIRMKQRFQLVRSFLILFKVFFFIFIFHIMLLLQLLFRLFFFTFFLIQFEINSKNFLFIISIVLNGGLCLIADR